MRLHTAMTTMQPRTPPPDWQRVSEGLRRFALALTGRSDAADELTQQTLAHLLARSPEKAAHAGYARRTMTRLWLDDQRSLRRRVRRYSLVARHAVAPPTGAERMANAEMAGAVRARIESLPPQQRAALVLRLIEDLDYEQVAEAMGTSVEAVRANLHLARRAVSRAMGEAP
jgi:RNA polymerase sigma factor (sigma-70 family)